MATTTNFGWTTPNDTDLVKDGAAAIRTLGQSIDTSLVDLKGGTTGQVLAKASNTDMDFVWSADAAGMTNPMTTTGDTIYSSSGSTPARLAIGSTGNVLTVAGGVPTWAAPAGGGGMTLLSTTTLSGTTTTISSISSSYKNLQLVIRRATTSNQAKIQIKPNASNQSTYSCKTSGAATWTENSGNIDPGIGQNNDSTNANFNLVMNFYNYADASNPTPFDWCGFLFDLGGNPVSMNGAGGYRVNEAISSIEILSTSGNLGGTALLYGVN